MSISVSDGDASFSLLLDFLLCQVAMVDFPQLQELITIVPKSSALLLSVDPRWVGDTCRSPAGQDSWFHPWAGPECNNSILQWSERPSVFLSENLLFREAGWVLPSIKQELRVVLYVSWKHITAFLWIMQHPSNYCRETIYPMCISRYFSLHTIYRTLNTMVRQGSVIATLIPTRYIV